VDSILTTSYAYTIRVIIELRSEQESVAVQVKHSEKDAGKSSRTIQTVNKNTLSGCISQVELHFPLPLHLITLMIGIEVSKHFKSLISKSRTCILSFVKITADSIAGGSEFPLLCRLSTVSR
jgi:hypothetical protein